MENIIKEIDQSEIRRADLVIARRHLMGLSEKYQYYAWTINIPTNHLIPRVDIRPSPPSLRIKNLRYRMLNVDQQINYLNKFIRELFTCCLFPEHEGATFYFELNSSGNIHAHGIVFTTTSNLDIVNVRKLCLQHRTCQRIHLGRNEMRLNYIHPIDNVREWIEYITKDYIKMGRVINISLNYLQ